MFNAWNDSQCHILMGFARLPDENNVRSYGFRRDVHADGIQHVIFIWNILECDSRNILVYSSEMFLRMQPNATL